MPSSQRLARELVGDEATRKPFRGTLRFELVRRLGRGGYGVVYEAFDHVRQAACALKVLTRSGAVDRSRFEQEFLALRELRHPNIVRAGELLEEDGHLFFTLDLVRGTQLLEHVRGRGRLDVARLRAVLGQLIDAVQAVHRAGKLHRDIKPANIIVSHGGRLALLDFGLVTEVGAFQRSDALVGTAAYMAPEQATGERVGPAADWYAVGAVLYEALTGQLPFEGTSFEILLAKQREEPLPPRVLEPAIPIELSALCAGLLKREPLWRLSGEEARALLGAPANAARSARVA